MVYIDSEYVCVVLVVGEREILERNTLQSDKILRTEKWYN